MQMETMFHTMERLPPLTHKHGPFKNGEGFGLAEGLDLCLSFSLGMGLIAEVGKLLLKT